MQAVLFECVNCKPSLIVVEIVEVFGLQPHKPYSTTHKAGLDRYEI